ncbi:NAD(P)H-dependent glycerol-3-phosphate dehydrogenase [Mycoplasma sp. 1781]
MKKRIAILGSGAMGTACGNVLAENGHDVIFYGINDNELQDLEKGFNKKYFDNKLITNFKTTKILEKAIENVEFIIIAIPSRFIPPVFEELIKLIKNDVTIINVIKGFWPNTNSFVHNKMAEMAKDNTNIKGITSLIGPSFAIDIINKHITIVNVVSKDINKANEVKTIFTNDWFAVSAIDDVIGAEIGSIYKNILAIASGIIASLGYSTNTQAALLTMGLKEMVKYGKFLGAKTETIYDLCGLGDLILTGLSEKSRNYQYGLNFLKNKIDDSQTTVEGLYALKYIYHQNISKNKLNLPLIEGIYKIVYNKENPQIIINSLIKRV